MMNEFICGAYAVLQQKKIFRVTRNSNTIASGVITVVESNNTVYISFFHET